MTQNIVLETPRFILREIEAGDIETLHSYWSDDIVTEYMTASFKTLEESRQMVELLNSLPETQEGMRWAIVDKNSRTVLGSCGYHNVKAEHRRAEVGYEIGRSYWGRGVMQEVMHAVLQHLFETFCFNRIEAFVTFGNNRSVHTLEKLGFKAEGVLRDYEFAKGNFQDQIVLALLRKDWENKFS
ncbi:MAG: GNAT family protein [Syntrophomonas sp.]